MDFLNKVVFYSTNSFWFEEVKTEQCIDKKITTSCFEICPDGSSIKENVLFIKPNECAFVWQISPSHVMSKFPPKKKSSSTFWNLFIRRRF
jgi:hypothetical protein